MSERRGPSAEDAHAIVMRSVGPPEVLRLERVPLQPLAPDEIRLKALVSAINHSDLAIRSGRHRIFRANPFPYVPGLETVGEVVACGEQVTDFRTGDRAITMMQGLGGVRAKRPGGYAEFVAVSATAASPLPTDLDPLDVAALGLASVTALEGLRKLGPLDGRRIAISGATGGVGSAAVSIARALGARVVALVSGAERGDYVRSLGAQEVVLTSDAAKGALGEETLDGVLDVIGGASFGPLVAALRLGAALSMVGAMAGEVVSFDAYRLLEVTLTGYSSERLDGAALRRDIATLIDWLRRGVLRPPAHEVYPLKDVAAAHETLEQRGVQGRLLLVP
jgi:NADPH:quinone reductase